LEVNTKVDKLTETKADAIVVCCFEETTSLDNNTAAIDEAMGGVISQLINTGSIKSKLNEITILHTLGKLPADRVAIVGMGKADKLTLDRVRGATGEVCRLLQKKNLYTIAIPTLGAGMADITPGDAAQAITEGALLGTYLFRQHQTKKAEYDELKELTIIEPDTGKIPGVSRGCDKGRILAEATNLARDMVNEPSNYMTPSRMVAVANKLVEDGRLEISVLEADQMAELGMGALLGVARGSQEPPKFIILRYQGTESKETDIALVGKGITFDSGGISIKPSEGMGEMKGDMAGGAAVIAAMGALARLKPKINVTAFIPTTENMPSGKAIKPGDILTAINGKTIEIITTDAEGRLILADALGYAVKLGVKRIVDVATLTGACRVALGDIYSGAFGNNQELTSKVIEAGIQAGELIWQMPMHEDYQTQLESDVADIKNAGNRWGGAITGAQFLAEFIDDTPWVHIDIAGTFLSDKERKYLVKGGTGVPVRTLVNFVLSLAN